MIIMLYKHYKCSSLRKSATETRLIYVMQDKKKNSCSHLQNQLSFL